LTRAGDVYLGVCDAAGRLVRTVAAGHSEVGRHRVTWDARDAAAGIYFYTLAVDKASVAGKLILTR